MFTFHIQDYSLHTAFQKAFWFANASQFFNFLQQIVGINLKDIRNQFLYHFAASWDPPLVLQQGFKKYCCHVWLLVGSHTGAFAPKGGDSEHKPSGVPPVAWLGEVEQNRIQKAVHTGKRPGALIDDWEHISHLAGCVRQRAHHQVHGLGEVKWQKAYAENCRHHDDHLHRLVSFLPGSYGDTLVGHRAAEDVGHPAVAHHHTHKRQQEAEAGQSHAIGVVVHRMLRCT